MVLRLSLMIGLARRARRILLALALLLPGSVTASEAEARIERIDLRVSHTSTAPGNAGESVALHVREKALASTRMQSDLSGRVVLFVHGDAAASAASFDLPLDDYSWMDALAGAGFVAIAFDGSGHGASPRPAMDDACNLSAQDRARIAPPADCAQGRSGPAITDVSDADELEAIVWFVRDRHAVERVSLIGWAEGGARAGAFAARYPDFVDRLVLLSPTYDRDGEAPGRVPAHPVRLVDRAELMDTRWRRRVSCENEIAGGVEDSVWRTALESDALGRAWGAPSGLLRMPARQVLGGVGWDQRVVRRIQAPTLILTGDQDRPRRKHQLHEDLMGVKRKVIVTLDCATRYTLWERSGHGRLHEASIEWLRDGLFRDFASGRHRMDAATD